MKRLFIVIIGLVAVAGTALAGVYVSLSPLYLKAEIEKTIAGATGRAIVIASSPRLSLWPQLAVIIDEVRLANPSGMAEGVFLDAGRLKLEMAAAALLHRKADIREVTLERPRLNLVIDREGQANWYMAEPEPTAEDAGTGLAPLPIFIEDGTVNFRDERSGETASFENLDLTLKLTSLLGPAEIEGHADWRGQRVQLALFVKSPQKLAGSGSPLDFNLSASWLALAFNGHGTARSGMELAGNIDVKSPSLGELTGWTKVASEPGSFFGTFEAKGALTLRAGVLALKNARLSVGGMKADGDVGVDLTQATPRVTARLSIDRLEIDRYLPARDPSVQNAGEGVEAWSRSPVDFSGLKAIDASAELNVGELLYGGLAARDVTVETTLTGGVLDAKLRDINLYGGRASGQIVLNGARKSPTVQASFQGRGLDGHRLLKDYTGFESIEGMTEIAVAVAAQGQNESEMIASLGGSAGFSFTGGAIRGFDVASLVKVRPSQSPSGWHETPGERTAFSLLKASFTLSDGVAENNDLQLLGPTVRVSGAGSVDLLRRDLDFRIEPRLVVSSEGEYGPMAPAALGVPLIVKGPWGKPTIAPEASQ